MSEGAVKHILLIGVARIGDTLLLTPAIRAIKEHWPDAHLTVLAHPKRMEVLENLPFIDTLGSVTKGMARWRGYLSRKSFDLAFVYGGESALLAYALRVSHLAYCFDVAAFKHCPPSGHLIKVPFPPDVHAVVARAALVEAAGVALGKRSLIYRVRDSEKEQAVCYLSKLGRVGERHPRIGLQAFSFPTKAHRDWPLQRFVELVRILRERFPEAVFFLLGDALAASRGQPLKEAFPEVVAIAAGTQSLRESAALMAQLDLYIGVDTGPTHIAGALDIPMVSMYHHLYPGRNLAPLDHAKCHVIEHPATGVETDEERAMDEIELKSVLELATQALCNAGFVRH